MAVTYSVAVVCNNCKKGWVVEIPIGESVDNFLKHLVCSRCGCSVCVKREQG